MNNRMTILYTAVVLLILGHATSPAAYGSEDSAKAVIMYMLDAMADDSTRPPAHQIRVAKYSFDSSDATEVWRKSFYSRAHDSLTCHPIPDTAILHRLGLPDSFTVCPPPPIRITHNTDCVVKWEANNTGDMIAAELMDNAVRSEDRFINFIVPDDGTLTIPRDICHRIRTWTEPILQFVRKRVTYIETSLGTTMVEGVSFARVVIKAPPDVPR